MKALISSLEIVLNGYRIAEVAPNKFDVAEPLFWVDCDNECTPDNWYFNTETQQCELVPIVEPEGIATPEPTKAELLAKLQEIQAQIAAL